MAKQVKKIASLPNNDANSGTGGPAGGIEPGNTESVTSGATDASAGDFGTQGAGDGGVSDDGSVTGPVPADGNGPEAAGGDNPVLPIRSGEAGDIATDPLPEPTASETADPEIHRPETLEAESQESPKVPKPPEDSQGTETASQAWEDRVKAKARARLARLGLEAVLRIAKASVDNNEQESRRE